MGAGESEAEGAVESVRSSDPRAPGVVFLYFPWCLACCVGCCAGLCFVSICFVCLCFVSFCSVCFTVWRKGGRGLLPLSPPLRQTGKQEKDKIVCRHSLAWLNASMIKPKKNK